MATQNVYRMNAQVGAGHLVQVVAPDIPEGESLEVVLLPTHRSTGKTAFDIIEALDLPERDDEYWAEREPELRAGRESWDR